MVEYKHSVCPHDCPDTCGLVIGVEHGRVVSVQGDPEHPFTRGAICAKVRQYKERVYSPLRIRRPLKRTGPKGTGQYRPISWDEALDEIVARYRRIMDQYGPEAILPCSYAGTLGVLQYHAGHPFFHKLGASKLNRNLCLSAANAGFAASLGRMPTTDLERAVDSDLIIIWGSNTVATNMHAWSFFLEARRRGAKIVVIDPYRNPTAKRANRHLAIKPGTDAALALGLMYVLIDEGLIDRDFVSRHTVGYERLTERVRAYPPSRVAETTGVAEAEIVQLAREYGGAKSPFLRIGYGLARQSRGGMAVRTIALLPGLIGATARAAGGVTLTTSPAFELRDEAVKQEDLCSGQPRTVAMSELGRALTELDQPAIKALHVYHTNPAVVCPESRMVMAGLRREDLFVVVHEHVMTETAAFADLVLPSTMALESTDLYDSYGHYYLQMARPVIEPVGEARTPTAIFQDLARRFGFTEDCFTDSEEQTIRKVLDTDSPYLAGITFDRLSGGRPVRLNVPDNPFAAGFRTPSGKIEFYSQTLADLGLDPLPTGTPSVDEGGAGRYPLHMISPPKAEFLNSTFFESQHLRDRAGQPTVLIHPADAAARNIEEGEVVRVYNDRGDCFLYAQLTEDTPPGLVVVEGLYWPRFAPLNRGVNQLTSQARTDMGPGCAFHTNLVEVEAAA